MKKHNVPLCLVLLSVAFCGIRGMDRNMEELQKMPVVQRQIVMHALSKLTFGDNEKILHVGFGCEDIIKKKCHELEVYSVNTDTLKLLEGASLGNGYDKIVSFVCWDVIRNPQEVFKDSARLLKQNGQFCTVLPFCTVPFGFGFRNDYLRIHCQTLQSDKWKDRYNRDGMIKFYDGDIKVCLQEAGLGRDIACDIIKKPFIFETREALTAWIESCPEQLELLDKEDHAEFINDLINNYLKVHFLGKNNCIKLHLPYMIVRACKS